MKFEGYLEAPGKDKIWGVEIPAFDLSTQGRSKAEAYRMAKSVVEDILDIKGCTVELEKVGAVGFNIIATDSSPLLALMIKRQRMKEGLTIREAMARAGLKSPSTFSAYETGKRTPGIEQLQRLLKSVGSDIEIKVGINKVY